jgi:hypothetical protein
MGINFNRIFPILRFCDIAKADEFAPLRQRTDLFDRVTPRDRQARLHNLS